ncbi:regulation of the spore photoproduct lyase operon [Geomicrobium sp. JCM 19037]|uniref:transcriptional regulator SplA domain-containing protein n=1 Tax=unclassified Geomicrobium TaxID=2628951 RepID=UPI00045F3825|nr:transcriptional regulator SplA domain-containing protein [Geomicrobium sp. JCM 19037]GAK03348.1 regulation of the spore photoproduct lyase operon [Geomicrobium sp. JCM 19037]
MELYKAGETLYVIHRNPHTQDVANIREATVVNDPDAKSAQSIFLMDEFYPLTEELAVFNSYEEAEEAYAYYFETDPEPY